MHGNGKGHRMREQYLPRENRIEKNKTVRRKPLVSGLRVRPVNTLSVDHCSVASKHCKCMQLRLLLTQIDVLGIRFSGLGKWLRASGTQVSETQAKLDLNIKKKKKRAEK